MCCLKQWWPCGFTSLKCICICIWDCFGRKQLLLWNITSDNVFLGNLRYMIVVIGNFYVASLCYTNLELGRSCSVLYVFENGMVGLCEKGRESWEEKDLCVCACTYAIVCLSLCVCTALTCITDLRISLPWLYYINFCMFGFNLWKE